MPVTEIPFRISLEKALVYVGNRTPGQEVKAQHKPTKLLWICFSELIKSLKLSLKSLQSLTFYITLDNLEQKYPIFLT
jgi:hypothetical protein